MLLDMFELGITDDVSATWPGSHSEAKKTCFVIMLILFGQLSFYWKICFGLKNKHKDFWLSQIVCLKKFTSENIVIDLGLIWHHPYGCNTCEITEMHGLKSGDSLQSVACYKW